ERYGGEASVPDSRESFQGGGGSRRHAGAERLGGGVRTSSADRREAGGEDRDQRRSRVGDVGAGGDGEGGELREDRAGAGERGLRAAVRLHLYSMRDREERRGDAGAGAESVAE